ncbi:S-layer homology domain-containing protein [Paenibacillus sp. GCM10027626]|uniref:S-layer homology domain-containing protein n=1 Tax=Paenibacillus sp. GCM10027626 TaxID=3273411 RepID=UPI00362D1B0A
MAKKVMLSILVFIVAIGGVVLPDADASSNPTPTVSGEFPIGIFFEPPPSDVSNTSFADIRAMNANFIVTSNLNTTPATTMWALDRAAENDLKMLVTDTGIRWFRSEWISQSDDTGTGVYLRNDRPIGQTFTSPPISDPDMGLWKLSFKKSGSWPAGTTVTASIYDSPAKTSLISSSVLSGPVTTDYPEFTILGAFMSASTSYYVELTTNSTTDLGPFKTSAADNYAGGQAYVNGVSQSNDLYFQMTLPRSGGGNWGAFSPTTDMTEDYIEHYVNTYKDHPALLGYNLVDEPFGDIFPKLKAVSAKIKAIDPNHMVYTNLYGVCDDCQHYYSGTNDPVNGGYENYVNGWLATDPDMISFDIYPYTSTGFLEKAYYQSLEYFRKQSLLNGTDLWAYIQSYSDDYLGMVKPSESQLKYQIYSTLAYGAKGYVYFTYYTPSFFDNGLILPDGTKNDTYDYAKSVNGEVLKLGSTLLSLTSKDVYHTGGVPPFATALPANYFWQPAAGQPEMPMIVSRFENEDGREFVMIVNKDLENAHTAQFTLSNTPSAVTEVSKTTGLEVATTYNAGSGMLTADFAPGEGRLFALSASVASGGDGGSGWIPPAALPSMKGIQLDAAPSRIKLGDARKLTVRALYENGSLEQLTAKAEFTSSHQDIVSVDADGNITGRSIGSATITAKYDRFTAAVSVQVVDGSKLQQQSERFEANQGGELKLGSQLVLRIPEGASAKPVTVTATIIDNPGSNATSGLLLASPVFEIVKEPADDFAKPVTVELMIDPDKQGYEGAAVYFFDKSKQEWVKLEGQTAGRTITVQATRGGVFAIFAAEPAEAAQTEFKDTVNHWARNAIAEAAARGIVKGFGEETFRPNGLVTRAEFAAMLGRALQWKAEDAEAVFTDPIPAWAAGYVAAGAKLGIITGYADQTFGAEQQISRAEMTAMIVRALKLPLDASTKPTFKDANQIAKWAKPSVAAAAEANLIRGKGGQLFAPQDKTTRAEAVTVVMNMLNMLDN